MKLSNKFTLTRIIFAPLFLFIYFIPIWTGKFEALSMYIAIPFLCFAEFTDFLDGHYARKHNEVSDFGKLFDPFADIILHMTTFLCFMSSISGKGYMQPWIFALILYREMTMNFIRMVAAKKGTAIAARKGGKLKTVFYVISGFFALFLEAVTRINPTLIAEDTFAILRIVSLILFIICVLLSYVSFIDYIVHFGKILKKAD
ncbi:MAG: CDP-diacylglycerol--glycerol-3-phosphate 3-phosphatidyltransferase [Treponema sp.]|nr:CDP-diacylglycerol--glycerol-3-phosphate 3-phosphatidyltransferase [Treponema sp.]